jgi:hypothetical protein
VNRLSVIHEIGDLTEQHCRGCLSNPARTSIRSEANAYRAACLACPIDKRLKDLGEQLTNHSTERRKGKIIEAIEEEKQMNEPKRGPKVLDGPRCGLTRRIFLEQIAAGETISSVERAWAISNKNLYQWIEKWGLKKINSERAQELLEAESGEVVDPKEEASTGLEVAKASDSIPALQQRIAGYEEETAKWHEIHKEMKLQVAEKTQQLSAVTADRDNWAKEYATLEEVYVEVKQDRDSWRGRADELKQALAEITEERAMLLATIEKAAEPTLKSDPNSTYQALTEIGVLQSPKDNVNHPAHYTAGGIETIAFIRAKLTPEEFAGYCKGNALKYVSRATHKGGEEDLRKAGVYLGWAVGGAR